MSEWILCFGWSEGVGYGPCEGAESEAGLGVIQGAEALQDGGQTVIGDDGDQGGGQRGPRVGAVVGLAAVAAAALICISLHPSYLVYY